MQFYCDNQRHLVCKPYSIENLHKMAKQLGIGRHFFEYSAIGHLGHYDIPAKRAEEIMAKCKIVSFKQIVKIIKNEA